jgi:hypothetical protein
MSPIVLYALVAFNNGSPQITMGMTAAQCIYQAEQVICASPICRRPEGLHCFFDPRGAGL